MLLISILCQSLHTRKSLKKLFNSVWTMIRWTVCLQFICNDMRLCQRRCFILVCGPTHLRSVRMILDYVCLKGRSWCSISASCFLSSVLCRKPAIHCYCYTYWPRHCCFSASPASYPVRLTHMNTFPFWQNTWLCFSPLVFKSCIVYIHVCWLCKSKHLSSSKIRSLYHFACMQWILVKNIALPHCSLSKTPKRTRHEGCVLSRHPMLIEA